jgi:HSP20 family protein
MAVNGRSSMRDFMSLRDAMDRFLDDRWISPGSWLTWTGSGIQYLPLDVYETADDVVVRALVPGVAADGIDVQYQQGTLTIRTKLEEAELPQGATWLLHEVGGGQSIRQVTLAPKVDVDQVQTTFEDGVLTLRLPKAADAKPKRIDVASAPRIGAGAGAD